MLNLLVEYRREIYVISIIALVIFLYAYFYYMYKAQKSGKRDYEKYSRLALDDDISDVLIESIDEDKKGV